jgi:hypothetical protein
MNDNQRPDLEERIKKIISDGPVLIEIPFNILMS